MAFTKKGNSVPMTSAALAQDYVRRLIGQEMRGPGDTEPAMRRIETQYGLPYWTLWHLWRGRAKTVEASVFQRLRGAYLNHCERKIATLQHELELERATQANDFADTDLLAEVQALAAKIEAAKEKITTPKGEC